MGPLPGATSVSSIGRIYLPSKEGYFSTWHQNSQYMSYVVSFDLHLLVPGLSGSNQDKKHVLQLHLALGLWSALRAAVPIEFVYLVYRFTYQGSFPKTQVNRIHSLLRSAYSYTYAIGHFQLHTFSFLSSTMMASEIRHHPQRFRYCFVLFCFVVEGLCSLSAAFKSQLCDSKK